MATEKQNPHIREHGFHLQGPDLGPTEEELAELARLGERFPRYYIFRHVTAERGVRYLAHRAAIEARPHTIITGDLAELRGELEQSAPQELGTSFCDSVRRAALMRDNGHTVSGVSERSRAWPPSRNGRRRNDILTPDASAHRIPASYRP